MLALSAEIEHVFAAPLATQKDTGAPTETGLAE